MLRGSLTFFKQLKSCPSEYQQEFYSKWFTGLKNANGDRIIDRVPTGRKERKSRTDGRSVKQTDRRTDRCESGTDCKKKTAEFKPAGREQWKPVRLMDKLPLCTLL